MEEVRFNLERIVGKKVLVFGDLMVDEYLQGSASRISPEAPVPVVHVQKVIQRLGGAGNVVLNLRALGAEVGVVSCIGNDKNGDWIADTLRNYQVDTAGILKSDSRITSVKTRVTAQNQQLLRYDREKVSEVGAEFTAFLQRSISQFMLGCCVVIISDYGKGVVTTQNVQLLIHEAKKRNLPVIVDPKGTDYKKYGGASVCTPNMKELQSAVGEELYTEDEIARAAKQLCQNCGIDNILATRSEKGMSFIYGDKGEKLDFPAVSKEVLDVTGAGDTVISIFSLCYALGGSIPDCCRLSNLAASIVVSKFGAATASIAEIYRIMGEPDEGESKVLSLEVALRKAVFLRQQGKKIVFTNGCFDLVHAGHISSFRQAKQFGNVLFLGVNSDASIRAIKGDKRPIVDLENRLRLLQEIECVDYLVPFEEDTPQKLIEAIKPDVLVKGKDWEGKPVAGADFVRSYGGEVKFIDLEQGLSTTNIIEKILTVYGGD